MIDDESGMATVTSNYRPSAYCEVILDKKKSTNRITETTSKDTSGNEPEEPPYDITNHVNMGVPKPHPSLEERYSSFNRPDRPDPSTRTQRIPQYDEIDIDPTCSRRPLLVTQTTGYSSLGPSTGTECATPTESKAVPPPKPPRPDLPAKPPVPSRPSSKEPSPSSPVSLSSPVHLTKKKESPLPPRKKPDAPSKGTNENLCLIDIDQLIAKAKAKELKIPGDDEPEEGVVDHTHPIAAASPSFTNSLVKLTDVLDDSVSTKPRAHTMHMYETLPCDIVADSKPARRKAPPPPPFARKGSPTLPFREKPDDTTKALTMGRKPRHLTVRPTNSLEGKEEKKQFTQSLQQSPSVIKKTSTSESPGTKSRFKFMGFMRSSSKEDSSNGGGSRGSMKKQSKKTSQPYFSPSPKVKSNTLPSRPRGKSLDPYMSSDIYSTVADIEDEVCCNS